MLPTALLSVSKPVNFRVKPAFSTEPSSSEVNAQVLPLVSTVKLSSPIPPSTATNIGSSFNELSVVKNTLSLPRPAAIESTEPPTPTVKSSTPEPPLRILKSVKSTPATSPELMPSMVQVFAPSFIARVLPTPKPSMVSIRKISSERFTV